MPDKDREKTQQINIVIPRSQLAALKAVAKREKRPYSSIVREALEEYLGVPDTVRLGRPQDEEESGRELAYAAH